MIDTSSKLNGQAPTRHLAITVNLGQSLSVIDPPPKSTSNPT